MGDWDVILAAIALAIMAVAFLAFMVLLVVDA